MIYYFNFEKTRHSSCTKACTDPFNNWNWLLHYSICYGICIICAFLSRIQRWEKKYFTWIKSEKPSPTNQRQKKTSHFFSVQILPNLVVLILTIKCDCTYQPQYFLVYISRENRLEDNKFTNKRIKLKI